MSDCFCYNLPSTSTWGSDPLLLPVSKGGGRRGVGVEDKTSWLCVWVRVAVSKVLCYVCHSWAGLSRQTTLLPPSANPKQIAKTTDAIAHSTVPTTLLVQDTECTMKQKLNHNHRLGFLFFFYVGFTSKNMKHEFASPSLKNKRVECVCERSRSSTAVCSWKGDSVSLILHFIFQFTAPSRGKALSVDFFSRRCYLPLRQKILVYWSITQNGIHFNSSESETLTFQS